MAGPAQSSGLQRLVQLLMDQSAPASVPDQTAIPFSLSPNNRYMPSRGLPPFQTPGSDFEKYQNIANPMPAVPSAPPTQPNIPQLGAEVPIAAAPVRRDVMPPALAPTPAPAVPAVVPPMPEPVPVGAGTREDVVKALQDMQRRNLLPEQWRGSFSNQYGEPT